jgi:hypothetical protein
MTSGEFHSVSIDQITVPPRRVTYDVNHSHSIPVWCGGADYQKGISKQIENVQTKEARP